jgi:hypothetical protein
MSADPAKIIQLLTFILILLSKLATECCNSHINLNILVLCYKKVSRRRVTYRVRKPGAFPPPTWAEEAEMFPTAKTSLEVRDTQNTKWRRHRNTKNVNILSDF